MKYYSPIFIMGVPRSGTTLLATILNQHSKLHVDKNALAIRICRFFNRTWENTNHNDHKKKIIEQLLKDDRLSKYLNNENLDNESISQFICSELSTIAKRNGKEFYVDKSPDAVESMEVILSLFPYSKFIFIVRDPRSNIVSLMRRQFLALGGAINVWVSYNTKILNYKNWIGKERMTILRYEDLVSCPEITVKKITDFIGLEYENSMIKISDIEDLKQDDSYVKPTIDSDKLNAWNKTLKPKNVKLIEQYAIKLMDYFGYKNSSKAIDYKEITYLQEAIWNVNNMWKSLFISNRVSMTERKLHKIKVPLYKRIKEFVASILLVIINPRIITNSSKK